MAKLLFDTKTQQAPRGVIVASLFKVDKVNGYSLKFKSKIRDKDNVLVDKTGDKLMEVNYGDGFLCLPNQRKRDGKRDPDFVVFAYPDAKPFVKK
ncbi:hypothetical protein KAW50_03520 [candidate division WOR-3 bacterium]|nr:hypothetical protein [candidate division WOR-3 bacterium]